MQHEPQDWVEVGCVSRAHGIRGEVRVKLHNQYSDILSATSQVLLRQRELPDRTVTITKLRLATPGIVLLALEGVSDRNASEALSGATLHVPRQALPQTDDGEFYIHDILQAEVVTIDGASIGKVVDYVNYPSTDVLVVQGEKRYEIPVIDDFVREIDIEAKRITVADVDDFETT